MSSLVKALDRLNRKERFWLLSDAVGREIPDNVRRQIVLSPGFIVKLQNELRTGDHPNLTIPEDAWWAFDYHLDWLFAVLAFAPKYQLDFDPRPNPVADFGDKYIRGTQEDCDLIIAFDSTIILLEAKVGESWSNRQLTSKMRRLKRLEWPEDLKRYFVLASPRPQGRVNFDKWPDWAFKRKENLEPYWIKLELPDESKNWLKVTRDDKEGKFWRLCEAGQ